MQLSGAGDLFYVNVDMSNHSKWFRFRFSRELPHSGRGSSQLPAIKHAIAALVSDVLVLVVFVVVAVTAGSECDILRVSVSHCCLVGLKQKAPQCHRIQCPALSFSSHCRQFLFSSLCTINNVCVCV